MKKLLLVLIARLIRPSDTFSEGEGKRLLLFTLLFSFSIICSYAQNPITSVSATAESTNPSSTFFQRLQQKHYVLNVVTENTEGVQKIAAMLGSSEGSNDIYYKEFDFGEAGNFDDGTSYSATGTVLTLGLGNRRGAGTVYAEVFAVYSDTVRSEGVRVRLGD